MTHFLLALTCLSQSAAGRPPAGDPAPRPAIDIHLLTIGPGAHLYTSGGHSAIMITRTAGDASETEVYNYGDADFEGTNFVLDFARGNITFFLSRLGDLTDTVSEYGVRQARDVSMQKLNLTETQKAAVITHLEEKIQPKERNYRFHHLHALCSSKIRDLLDEVTGGAIAEQLKGNPDPYSIRHYQEWAFYDHWAASLGSALFMGRMHDGPTDKWTAAFLPRRMAQVLREVRVPAQDGSGGTAPLAEAPQVVVQRQAPIPKGRNLFPVVAGWVFFGLLLVLFLVAFRRLPQRPRLAGVWLLLWSIPTGLVGLGLLLVLAISTVPEWRNNELIASMLVTDLALVVPAVRWLRGQTGAGRLPATVQGGPPGAKAFSADSAAHGAPLRPPWPPRSGPAKPDPSRLRLPTSAVRYPPEQSRLLRVYAGVRFAAMVLLFVLRAVGVLYQEPAIYPGTALLGACCLWMMVRRMDAP